MYQNVTLVGNVGRDPEIRSLPSGSPVANFSVATSRTWKKDGERQEATEWHNVVAYGKLAEIVGQYVTRGQMVVISGRIETRSWEKDGEKKYKTEIIAEELRMIGRGSRRQEPKPDAGKSWPDDEPGEGDDSVPF